MLVRKYRRLLRRNRVRIDFFGAGVVVLRLSLGEEQR